MEQRVTPEVNPALRKYIAGAAVGMIAIAGGLLFETGNEHQHPDCDVSSQINDANQSIDSQAIAEHC